MEVEWDPNKAAINLQKHSVSFSEAEAVLFDPNALSFEDTTAQVKIQRLKENSDLLRLEWTISGAC